MPKGEVGNRGRTRAVIEIAPAFTTFRDAGRYHYGADYHRLSFCLYLDLHQAWSLAERFHPPSARRHHDAERQAERSGEFSTGVIREPIDGPSRVRIPVP